MSPTSETRPIGEQLVAEGLIKREHIDKALAVQKERGGKMVQILVQLGYLDVNAFARFMSTRKGIASIDLKQYEVSEEVCALVPREFALAHDVFPIDKMGRLLTLGMAFPLDRKTIEELESMTGLRVKALFCQPEDIQNAIKEAYAAPREELSDLEMMIRRDEAVQRRAAAARLSSISALIRQIESLPALPQTVQKVQEMMENPDVSMDALAEVIAMDPLISAKMLRLVNSAAYNLPKRIDNVGMAVKLLGLRETSVAVLTSSVVNVLESARNFDYGTFWREAVFTSHAAKGIMKMRGKPPKTATAAGALLHDIGCFALSQSSALRYQKIGRNLKGTDLINAETAEFSIGHPEAGFMLAEHWSLPGDIAAMIRYHHTPHLAKDYPEDALVVALAAYMAELFSIHAAPEPEVFAPVQGFLIPLDMTTGEAIQVYQESAAALEKGL